VRRQHTVCYLLRINITEDRVHLLREEARKFA